MLPNDVRLQSVTPTFDKDGLVHLSMTCITKTGEGLTATINRFNGDPHFANAFPTSETATDRRVPLHARRRLPSVDRPEGRMIWREKRVLLIVLGLLLLANTIFFFTYRVQYVSRLQDLDARQEQTQAQLDQARNARITAEQQLAAYKKVQAICRCSTTSAGRRRCSA